jgi:hypothetical protein
MKLKLVKNECIFTHEKIKHMKKKSILLALLAIVSLAVAAKDMSK